MRAIAFSGCWLHAQRQHVAAQMIVIYSSRRMMQSISGAADNERDF